jgi:hypothetical protein
MREVHDMDGGDARIAMAGRFERGCEKRVRKTVVDRDDNGLRHFELQE